MGTTSFQRSYEDAEWAVAHQGDQEQLFRNMDWVRGLENLPYTGGDGRIKNYAQAADATNAPTLDKATQRRLRTRILQEIIQHGRQPGIAEVVGSDFEITRPAGAVENPGGYRGTQRSTQTGFTVENPSLHAPTLTGEDKAVEFAAQHGPTITNMAAQAVMYAAAPQLPAGAATLPFLQRLAMGARAALLPNVVGGAAQAVTQNLAGDTAGEAARSGAMSTGMGIPIDAILNTPGLNPAAKAALTGALGFGAGRAAGLSNLGAAGVGLGVAGAGAMAGRELAELLPDAFWTRVSRLPGMTPQRVTAMMKASDPEVQKKLLSAANDAFAGKLVTDFGREVEQILSGSLTDIVQRGTERAITSPSGVGTAEDLANLQAMAGNLRRAGPGAELRAGEEAAVSQLGPTQPMPAAMTAVESATPQIPGKPIKTPVTAEQSTQISTKALQKILEAKRRLAPVFEKVRNALPDETLDPVSIQYLEAELKGLIEDMGLNAGDPALKQVGGVLGHVLKRLEETSPRLDAKGKVIREGKPLSVRSLLDALQTSHYEARALFSKSPNAANAARVFERFQSGPLTEMIERYIPKDSELAAEWGAARTEYRELMDMLRDAQRPLERASGMNVLPGNRLRPSFKGPTPGDTLPQRFMAAAQKPDTTARSILRRLGLEGEIPPATRATVKAAAEMENIAERLVPNLDNPGAAATTLQLHQTALNRLPPETANTLLAHTANRLLDQAGRDAEAFSVLVQRAIAEGHLPPNTPLLKVRDALIANREGRIGLTNYASFLEQMEKSQTLDEIFNAGIKYGPGYAPDLWQKLMVDADQASRDRIRIGLLEHMMRGEPGQALQPTQIARRLLGQDPNYRVNQETVQNILGPDLFKDLQTYAEAALRTVPEGSTESLGRQLVQKGYSSTPVGAAARRAISETYLYTLGGALGAGAGATMLGGAKVGLPVTVYLLARPYLIAREIVRGRGQKLKTFGRLLGSAIRAEVAGQEPNRAP